MKKINKELLSNITVLYVEDEEMIREEVSYFFKKYIKNFHTASNGIEGIEVFNKIKPDLIITDIQMPRMNGLEMLKQLDLKNIPIIITTAYSDIDYFLKAIELSVDKFVIKPIDLTELIFDIQECIFTNNLQDKIFEKENLLKIVDENVFLSVTDEKGVIIDASHAFCNLVGYTKEELLGKTHNILKHEDTPESTYKNMWDRINSGHIFNTEIKNRKKNGDVFWSNLTITPAFRDSEIVNFTAIRQDITNKKKLEQLAIKDELTNLFNRRYFNEMIDREIRRVKREKSVLSLLFFDVDYFKKYNDNYGHPKGDQVLIDIAKVLKDSTLRASDYAFRIGGEEFAIVFSGLSKEESLEFSQDVIQKVESLQIEHKFSGCSDYVTISAGLIVQNYENLVDLEYLYKHSDEALYKAKIEGRNRVVISNESN